MTILAVSKVPGVKCKHDINGKTINVRYRVQCDVADTSPLDILGASAGGNTVPVRGDYFPGSASIRAYEIEVEQDGKDRLFWNVDVAYRNSTLTSDQEENPLDEDPLVTWDFQAFVEPVTKDAITGKLICNSAGDAFDPPLEQDTYRLALEIRQNMQSFSPSLANDVIGSTNSGNMTICGLPVLAGQALMANRAAQSRRRNGVDYWEVATYIMFKADGFTRSVMNAGYRYSDGGNPAKLIDFMEAQNPSIPTASRSRLGTPWFLDTNGRPLFYDEAGGPKKLSATDLASVVYLPFNTYKRTSWSSLGLPVAGPF